MKETMLRNIDQEGTNKLNNIVVDFSLFLIMYFKGPLCSAVSCLRIEICGGVINCITHFMKQISDK